MPPYLAQLPLFVLDLSVPPSASHTGNVVSGVGSVSAPRDFQDEAIAVSLPLFNRGRETTSALSAPSLGKQPGSVLAQHSCDLSPLMEWQLMGFR